MRVLLCSDVHGNAEALAAVLEQPADYVLCAGDLVHFGPRPAECVDLVRQRATLVVRGNHDHGAGFGTDCRAYGPWRSLDQAGRTIMDAALSPAHCRYLRSLALTETITLEGTRFAVVHAAPSDPLYHYLPPETRDEIWTAELAGVDADVLVLGHTHVPFVRTSNRPIVVNPGSVGLPRDGDTQARYAIWEDGNITLHRCSYDHGPLLAALDRLPLPAAPLRELKALFTGQWSPER
jgi:putative phosphoesterase